MRLTFFLIAIAVFLCGPAVSRQAVAQEAAQLHDQCKAALRVDDKRGSGTDTQDAVMCVFWVQGFLDGLTISSVLSMMAKTDPIVDRACIPVEEIRIGQFVQMLVNEGNSNPTVLSESKPVLALSTLTKNYGCRATQ